LLTIEWWYLDHDSDLHQLLFFKRSLTVSSRPACAAHIIGVRSHISI
jgi:hypothetical protein